MNEYDYDICYLVDTNNDSDWLLLNIVICFENYPSSIFEFFIKDEVVFVEPDYTNELNHKAFVIARNIYKLSNMFSFKVKDKALKSILLIESEEECLKQYQNYLILK